MSREWPLIVRDQCSTRARESESKSVNFRFAMPIVGGKEIQQTRRNTVEWSPRVWQCLRTAIAIEPEDPPVKANQSKLIVFAPVARLAATVVFCWLYILSAAVQSKATYT